MNGLRMRHLLAIPLIVFLITGMATRCTELQPAANRLVHVPDLMKAHQDLADYETAKRALEMERMSDKELARGIVYEPNR